MGRNGKADKQDCLKTKVVYGGNNIYKFTYCLKIVLLKNKEINKKTKTP